MWYTIVVTLVIDIGGLLLVYALLRDRIRRATSAAAQIAEVRDEVSRLVVELNQTTERNVALLEDRIAALNELLGAADRKIGLLRREIEKHDVGAQVYSRLAESKSAAGRDGAAGADAGRKPASAGAQRASPGAAPPQPAGAGEGRDARRERTAGSQQQGTGGGEHPAGREDLHQRVVMLSRSGFSPSLIAARVGVPLGEVELILALERQRQSQAATMPGEQQG